MSDNIDTMTHDVLKLATRRLVEAARMSAAPPVISALAAFDPTPTDRLHAFLKAEGWRPVGMNSNNAEIYLTRSALGESVGSYFIPPEPKP